MKNQYFGDINDYVKYSILRAIQAESETRMLVCWMLTPNDQRGDGRLTSYLRDPARFRPIDPPLFDCLAGAVEEGSRRVSVVEEADVLPRTTFYSSLLHDALLDREQFFGGLWSSLHDDHAVVFFDPDNGLAVNSVAKGARGSRRYLYWDEVRQTTARGHAVIIYRHFPRVPRDDFVRERLAQLAELTPGFSSFALYESRVAYLFGALPRHASWLRAGIRRAAGRWKGRLRTLGC
jgi:hypothetical protein